jgi:hypothetical protein
LDEAHEAEAFPARGKWLAGLCDGRKGVTEELVHGEDVAGEKMVLGSEDAERVWDDVVLACEALGDAGTLGLDGRPYEGFDKVGVNALESVNDCDAQLRRLQRPAATVHLGVAALEHALDVRRHGGIRADAVALHEAQKLRFGEETWR